MSGPASGRVATAVAASRRYRDVDAALVRRLAEEELAGARSEAEAVKRVKRRLHQAVGAYAPSGGGRADLERLSAAWDGSLAAPRFQDECVAILRRHASTRERLAWLDGFYPEIWRRTDGPPPRLLDLGCGLGPLALPWMRLAAEARYVAVDADGAQIATVDGFLDLVRQPHATEVRDLAADLPLPSSVEVALLLKLVPLLDRRDPRAAERLLAALDARHAVVSFPARSLGGRGKGMERTYRERLESLVAALGPRIAGVDEASVPNELVFVLHLAASPAAHG